MPKSRTLPRIALTMRITDAEAYDEPRDSIAHDWISRLRDWRALPMLIPNGLADPCGYLDGLSPDLLILSGGEDPGNSPMRDETETALLAHAIENAIPVLGVCRGLQLMNLYFGGALTPVTDHVARNHGLAIDPAWRKVYGREITVNSFHRLGVSDHGLAKPLSAFAWDPDGFIEGVCHRDFAVAGLMWHPERGEPRPGDELLVRQLVGKKAFWQ
jgi:N5-(cytidine 5'-diphosphoramidyl)-L-glutamine hydrolase